MLNSTFSLFDVRDVEAFAERAIQRSGLTEFGYLEREDLLSECVAHVWELSASFNPGPASFSSFAGERLSYFIVKWKRSEFRTRWVFKDRIYERERPVFVGLDHRRDEPDPASQMDTAAGGLSDLLGIQRTRGSGASRDDVALGEEATRAAA